MFRKKMQVLKRNQVMLNVPPDTPDNLTIGSDVSASRSNLFEAGSPFQQCRSLARFTVDLVIYLLLIDY